MKNKVLFITFSILFLIISSFLGWDYYNEHKIQNDREDVKEMLSKIGDLANESIKDETTGTVRERFLNWKMPASFSETPIGNFEFDAKDSEIRIRGIGNEIGKDGKNKTEVRLILTENNKQFIIWN